MFDILFVLKEIFRINLVWIKYDIYFRILDIIHTAVVNIFSLSMISFFFLNQIVQPAISQPTPWPKIVFYSFPKFPGSVDPLNGAAQSAQLKL